ncbi:MAG: hypothetical protein LBK18_08695, partial [Prevotellaceae bacterium]|nr:hypothetical protein [Prevotellaceae bacterium]
PIVVEFVFASTKLQLFGRLFTGRPFFVGTQSDFLSVSSDQNYYFPRCCLLRRCRFGTRALMKWRIKHFLHPARR